MSSIAGSLRWVLLQILLTDLKNDSNNNNKLMAIYLFSPYTLLILPVCFATEGMQFYESLMFRYIGIEAISLSIVGGLIAFALIMVEMQLVNSASALSMAVIGQLKEVTQIFLAMIIFKDQLSIKTAIGIIVSVAASYYYRSIKITETNSANIIRYDRLDRFIILS